VQCAFSGAFLMPGRWTPKSRAANWKGESGMKTKKNRLATAALLLAAILAWGCVAAYAAPDTSVTIVDVAGRTVTLPKPAQKLAGTHNPTLNIAVLLGGGGRYIVGFGNKNMAGGLYGYVYPELEDVPQVGRGGEVNMESCVEAGAELAILPERFADLAEQFEAAGIPAAVILPNSESFETIKQSIELLGALIGEDERAAEIIAYYNEKIEAAKAIAARAEASPGVLFLGGSNPLSVANGLMLQSLMIETVGAVNAAKDVEGRGGYIEVSLEEIIGWNPDVIYIPAFAQYTADDLLTDASWGSVSAVKNRRVHMFPSLLEPWDYPTPSTLMGLGWMLNNLYPDLYSMEQVLEDAQAYYGLIYGQSFSAEQLGLE